VLLIGFDEKVKYKTTKPWQVMAEQEEVGQQEQQQQSQDWNEIPRFRIDLDQPPRQRWKHIVPHFKPYLKVSRSLGFPVVCVVSLDYVSGRT